MPAAAPTAPAPTGAAPTGAADAATADAGAAPRPGPRTAGAGSPRPGPRTAAAGSPRAGPRTRGLPTGIVVEARAARFTKVSAERAAETFGRVETAGDEALGSMRRLVKILRESDGDTTGPAAGGPGATAPVAGLADIRVLTQRFAVTGPPVVLYVQEDLAERLPAHVAATAVRIGPRTVPAGLEVRIADDGGRAAELSDQARGGYGLAGMAERAEAIGGSLTAGPAPEGGRLGTATLPL
ncbi:sensor histidine kinase [Streptomyces sp. NPDC060028]|uniref:sensor histidine kinase n=1 Tax=Streptomyces sp. NPDC060028 TaxID=3347041 RepID=UPI0036CB9948